MYCKSKLYSGAGEISFEQLRAFRWEEQQKKLRAVAEAEAERQRQMMQAMQEQMQHQFHAQQSQMSQQILQLQTQLQQLQTQSKVAQTSSANSSNHTPSGCSIPSLNSTHSDRSAKLILPAPHSHPNSNSINSSGSMVCLSLFQLCGQLLQSDPFCFQLSGPSPTVNTQMAFNQVREWYGNTSITTEFQARYGNPGELCCCSTSPHL